LPPILHPEPGLRFGPGRFILGEPHESWGKGETAMRADKEFWIIGAILLLGAAWLCGMAINKSEPHSDSLYGKISSGFNIPVHWVGRYEAVKTNSWAPTGELPSASANRPGIGMEGASLQPGMVGPSQTNVECPKDGQPHEPTSCDDLQGCSRPTSTHDVDTRRPNDSRLRPDAWASNEESAEFLVGSVLLAADKRGFSRIVFQVIDR
jgi:hypothetical protein